MLFTTFHISYIVSCMCVCVCVCVCVPTYKAYEICSKDAGWVIGGMKVCNFEELCLLLQVYMK